jgi:hypothetical protein
MTKEQSTKQYDLEYSKRGEQIKDDFLIEQSKEGETE